MWHYTLSHCLDIYRFKSCWSGWYLTERGGRIIWKLRMIRSVRARRMLRKESSRLQGKCSHLRYDRALMSHYRSNPLYEENLRTNKRDGLQRNDSSSSGCSGPAGKKRPERSDFSLLWGLHLLFIIFSGLETNFQLRFRRQYGQKMLVKMRVSFQRKVCRSWRKDLVEPSLSSHRTEAGFIMGITMI